MTAHGHLHAQATPETALDALLTAEREAASRLEIARAEAAGIVRSAQSEVEAFTVRAEEIRKQELTRLEDAQRVALAEIERTVAQSTAVTLARYEALSDDDVNRLALVILLEISGLPKRAS